MKSSRDPEAEVGLRFLDLGAGTGEHWGVMGSSLDTSQVEGSKCIWEAFLAWREQGPRGIQRSQPSLVSREVANLSEAEESQTF